MFIINKVTSSSTVDYAAEELKKYLRMMMPEGGDVKISYAPDAKDGFRLGLMADFGLDISDAADTELDDILYINCDTSGGVIAGTNPRSVLLAVYEYLRQNGCRWLFPGVDGELIPMQDIKPVEYRHKPSMRYRGWCNEGAEYQQCMLDAIEFAPKVGLNIFMLEAHIPFGYYDNYYSHPNNANYRTPEPVSRKTILQWKRQCEAEIAKRGLQFHDIGHGWTAYPFGVKLSANYNLDKDNSVYGEDMVKYIAEVDGVRGVYRGNFMNTNYCMSNPDARALVTKSVVEHARRHTNADYIHVWLSDGLNSHCECAECRKKTPSDWYVIQLNEIDEALTKEGLPSRIVFIAYLDTVWPPITERLANPDRFTLLIAPITRKYSESVPDEGIRGAKPTPYVRNKCLLPSDLESYLEYFELWKAAFPGPSICYEYHFWRPQFYDITGVELAKVINRDVKAYRSRGVMGIIEDGSQRSFFPTGLALYTYARSQFDVSLTADEIREEYFSALLGEAKGEIEDYLARLEKLMPAAFIMGNASEDLSVSKYYSPSMLEKLAKVPDAVSYGRQIIEKYYNSDARVRTVAIRTLELHALWVERLAKALAKKAVGDDKGALEEFAVLKDEMGKREAEHESIYDFNLSIISLNIIFNHTVSRLPEAAYQNV